MRVRNKNGDNVIKAIKNRDIINANVRASLSIGLDAYTLTEITIYYS